MDRSLLTPRWVVTHVLMVVAVVTMVALGFWQLDRLDGRRDRNREIDSRSAEPVVDLDELVAADDGYDVGETIRYRPVVATGVYVPTDEILVRNRTFNGAPGFWVLTPLRLDSGDVVVVNRGWIPFRLGPGNDRAEVAPVDGTVTVRGNAQATVVAEGLAQADGAGPLESLGRVDLARYEQELGYDVLPVFVQLADQQPGASGDLPVPVPLPELDEGSHLSYAVQWFLFATIAAVGYPLALRRLTRRRGDGTRHSDVPVDYL